MAIVSITIFLLNTLVWYFKWYLVVFFQTVIKFLPAEL